MLEKDLPFPAKTPKPTSRLPSFVWGSCKTHVHLHKPFIAGAESLAADLDNADDGHLPEHTDDLHVKRTDLRASHFPTSLNAQEDYTSKTILTITQLNMCREI
jgi:hypothetical protein